MNRHKSPPKIREIGNLYGYKIGSGFAGAIYSIHGIAPTLHAHSGGNTMPFILLEYPTDIAVPQRVHSMASDINPTNEQEIQEP